jgi:hypothetical protein
MADGCPVAALAADIARHPRAVRVRFEKALREYRRPSVQFLPGATKEEKILNSRILFPGMAGVLNTARAIGDEDRRESLLATAREFYVRSFCSSK